MSLADELRAVVRGEVVTDAKVLDVVSRDASLFRVVPEVVVRPLDAQDICALVQFVNKKVEVPKTHISITPRSACTDMSGWPLGDSIVLVTDDLRCERGRCGL